MTLPKISDYWLCATERQIPMGSLKLLLQNLLFILICYQVAIFVHVAMGNTYSMFQESLLFMKKEHVTQCNSQ